MINGKEFFSGNFLKAEDCKGGEVCEILDEGEVTELRSPEGKVKAVMNFQISFNVGAESKERTFTPNQTNGNIFVEAFGETTDKWVGKRFKIILAKVLVFGKMKNSIVVEPLDVVPTEQIQ